MTLEQSYEKAKSLTTDDLLSAAKSQLSHLARYIMSYEGKVYHERMFLDDGGDYTNAELEAARQFFDLMNDDTKWDDQHSAVCHVIEVLREYDAGDSYCDEVRAIVGQDED